jgi:hypothetical protein
MRIELTKEQLCAVIEVVNAEYESALLTDGRDAALLDRALTRMTEALETARNLASSLEERPGWIVNIVRCVDFWPEGDGGAVVLDRGLQ